ncbi:MAG: hypothetical protein HDT43_07045 [Ruminococcaceae bacterium]|nr:hypothetical protein [Oscillospiraceae bacterium]
MPKKITIVSGAALVLLAAIVAVLLSVTANRSTSAVPRRVSVYIPERGEILTMNYADFLAGCVTGLTGGENLADEALAAVAAAENSRAMYELSTKKGFQNLGADFTVGGDFPFVDGEPDERVSNAVRAAEKLLLTLDGEPIKPQMCMLSSGRTDETPLSPSVALPCDIGANGFESRTAFTTEEVRRALHKNGTLSADCSEWFSGAVYADTGTLLYIEFNGERMTGAALKQAFGLRSVAITVEYAEDKFRFTCLGLGENKGMSINAADFMAKNGSSAEEILKTFYSAELEKI